MQAAAMQCSVSSFAKRKHALDHGRFSREGSREFIKMSASQDLASTFHGQLLEVMIAYVAKKTKHSLARSLLVYICCKDRQELTFNPTKPSAIACAIPTPSLGDVPRPSSSINTKDCLVARPSGQMKC